MDFILDFALVGLFIVTFTAFLGLISTKIAGLFGGKKKNDAFERTLQSKTNWKPVQRKRT